MVDPESVLKVHKERKGKYEILSKVPLGTREELSTFYTPGVAYVSEAIARDESGAYEYTTKGNTIAIVSDGTRVLGLGDIGPKAALPVMEGKAILFKKFGGVDAIPICIGTKDENEIIKFATQIAPTFGALNIEDIESPKSIRIADRLARSLDIPVFHDDQEGTSVVVLAALLNAMKIAGKKKDAKIVINGAGSAGIGIARLLTRASFSSIYVLDTSGLIYKGRKENMNEFKEEIAKSTNRDAKSGTLSEAAEGADVLIGVSQKGAFSKELISKMNERPIVFSLANPYPEIGYSEAKEAGAYVVATGASNTPNQVNNILAFPSIIRGLLDVRAKGLNYEMLESAAIAIAKSVGKDLSTEKIVPDPLEKNTAIKIAANVSAAVAAAAMKTGMARVEKDAKEVRKNTAGLIKRYWRMERKLAV
jgi:malate dehydrogenase (oxaloacetate-decarboxylating)